jgi:hypothetical protein
MSVVGDITRALISAAPGHRLIAADFSGIESRLTAWISGQQDKLNRWAKFDRTGDPHDEPYSILGKTLGVAPAQARTIGKTADLAFGYMGGVGAWKKLAPDDDTSTDAEIKRRQKAWQRAHPNIVKFWGRLNRAAIQAVRKPHTVMTCGRVAFEYDGMFLRMRLPSGRRLAYPFPKLRADDRGNLAVVFMDNAGGKWTECRRGDGAYGGTWIENAVQAVARDLFAGAMPRLEAAGYPIVLHVHDEIVCEVPDGIGNVDEFRTIMITPPAWADGLPIAAKARNGARFAKIEAPRPAEPIPARQSIANTTPEPEILQQNRQAPPWVPDQETPMQPPLNSEPGETPKHIEDAAPIVLTAPAMPVRRFNGYPHGEEEPAGQKSVAEFIYRNPEQAPYLKVRKFEWFKNGKREKSFPQRWPVNGGWVSKKPADWVPIPYRLPELLAAPADAAVDIFEGEKDADRGAALGLIATTNPGGAGKWGSELNEYFRGRRVRIHEDHDDAGRAHVAKVAAALKEVAKEITVVRYPEVPPGEDFSWFMDQGGTLKAMITRAEPYATKLKFNLVCAADVVPRKLDWLWRGHLLRGALELSAGQPGLGKSQAQCSFAAYATKGAVWPDGAPGCPPGYVIMLTAEDCLDQILVPRLIAAGAIRERVLILKSIRVDEKDGRAFLLSEHIEALEQLLLERPDVRLVTLDPITAYMGGKLDSHRTTDVRHQLGPLAAMAERTNVAFSAITHPPKNAGPSAMNHYIGSQAFIAAARIGHLFVEEMEVNEYGKHMPTGRQLFTNPKNNPHPPMPTLAYRVEGADGGKDHDGEIIKTSRVVWGEVVEITADEAIAAATPKKDKDQQGAKAFLLDMLAHAPVPKKVIEERAQARGFSPDQLRRARESMGVVTFKDGFQGASVWCLPQHAPKDAKPCD